MADALGKAVAEVTFISPATAERLMSASDAEILELGRREAIDFVAHPPDEESLRRAVAYIRDHWQRRYGLVTVG